MAGAIKGITVEIGGDTTKLGKALAEVNKQSKSLQSELKGVNSLLKLDPTNVTLLKQKQDILNESLEKSKTKLDALKQAMAKIDSGEVEATEEEYRSLQRQIVATEQKVENLTDELKKFGSVGAQQIAAVGKKVESVGDKIEGVGKKLAPFSAAAAGVLVGATKATIDYESAWTGVTKTVDGTDEQLNNIKQGILDLSKNTASSAEDIASVAEAAGQLGIETDNILNFTETMVQLGDSTNLSADEAASALAKFANVTNMSAGDYDKLGSVIVDLGNNFATTESDIVSMATRLASTGEITGLTEPQIMALATALSSAGIEAEAGGSAMAKLLKKLYSTNAGFDTAKKVIDSTGYSLRDLQLMQSNNSSGFKDLADSLGLTKKELSEYVDNVAQMNSYASTAGVSVEQFRKAYAEDAVGALSMFITGLNNTERNGKSAVEILNEMGLTEVRLSNAVLSMASSGDLMTNAIKTANGAWSENTALTTEAEKRYSTSESKITQLKNTITELAIKLGSILLPIVSKVVESISGIVEKITAMDKTSQTIIVVVTAIVAALGPLLIFVGKIISSVGTIMTLAPKIVSGIKMIGGGLKALFGLIMAHPVIAIITAIIAAVVLLYTKCEWFRNAVNAVLSKIKEIATNVFNALVTFFTETIPNAINSVVTFFQELPKKITNAISNLVSIVSNIFTKVKNTIFSVAENIYNKLPTGFQLVVQNVQRIIQNLVAIFQNVFGIIKTVVQTVISVIKAIFSGDFASIPDIVSGALEKIKGFFSNIFDSIVTIIVNWIAIAINYFRGVGESIVMIFKKIGETLLSWWESIKTFFTEKVPEIISNIVAWFAALPGKIWNAIVSAVTKIAEWGARMQEKAKSVVTNVITAVINFFKQLPSKIWNAIISAVTKIGEWGVNMKNKAVTAMRNMVTGIINTVKSLPNKFLSIGKDIISGLWNGISGAISGLYTNIKNALSGLVGKAKEALGINSPSRVFRDTIGAMIPPGIALGVKKTEDQATGAVDDMINDLTDQELKINGATINRKLNTTFGNPEGAANAAKALDAVSLMTMLQNILDKLGRLQVVLNSGELVGGIIDEIDGELSNKYSKIARGW